METTQVSAIPQGYHSLTPYLIVSDAQMALEFYAQAFGASEVLRTTKPNGEIGHCEIQIGDSRLMFSEHFGQIPAFNHDDSAHSSLLIYVDNVDEFFERAISLGAELIQPVQDQFYGDRMGTLKDPFGHFWHIGTHIEDVSSIEMQRRAEERWHH